MDGLTDLAGLESVVVVQELIVYSNLNLVSLSPLAPKEITTSAEVRYHSHNH